MLFRSHGPRSASARRGGSIAALAAVGLCGGGSAAAADAGGFERQTLRVPGTVQWVTDGDLDGDGRRDLVVSYRRKGGPASERFFAIFYRSARGFGTRPSHMFRAPGAAAVFDVGPALAADAEAPRDQLLFWAWDGLFSMSFAGRRVRGPKLELPARTLIGAPEEEDLPHWDFARRVDGAPLLVVPTSTCTRLYRPREGAWHRAATLPIRPLEQYDPETETFRPAEDGGAPTRNYALRVTRSLPKLTFIDQTGDGRADVVASFEDRVEVYRGRLDGTVQPEPVARTWFRLRTPAEIENRDATLYSTVVHLDGDGVADLCISKSAGGLTTFRSEVQLYRGVRGGGFEPEPAQVFERASLGSLVSFVDVDGDGRAEMLQPAAEISLAAMVRALFAKSFQVDIRIHRPREADGFFEPDPVQVLTARFDLDLGSSATVRGAPPLFGHDFDGDGAPDALMSDGGDRIALHSGVPADGTAPKRPFRADAFVGLEGPTSGTTVVLPAGRAGGRPDVLVYYVGRDDLRSQLLVHANRYRPEVETTP
jgi:hypothetical protein